MRKSNVLAVFLSVSLIIQSGVATAAMVNDINSVKEFLSSDTTSVNVVTNFKEMVDQNKLSAQLTNKPWAGYYWPDGFGGIADPYRDKNFPHSVVRMIGPNSGYNRTMRWLKRSFRGESLTPKIAELSDEQVDELSPAEKYDLLFSNSDFTLTHTVFADIDYRVNHVGRRMAVWVGICNGWSLAALNVDRPIHPVTIQSVTGRPITFYPHDIMALSAMLYARSPVNNWAWYVRNADGTRTPISIDEQHPELVQNSSNEPVWLKFLGRRCNAHGDTSGCGDLNPAALHLSIVNSIGYQDSGFIMDKHDDISISNVAVFGYEAKLFNPKNGKSGNYAESVQVVDGKTKVGVDMELEFRKELAPFTLSDKDIAHYWDLEKSSKLKFSYILTLDKAGNVIEGEWTKRVITKYPDFLWKLPKGSMAFSGYEGSLNMFDWAPGAKVPASWIPVASDSSKSLQPLGVVVYDLVNQSRN